MSAIAQNVVFGSLVVAGLTALACLADLMVGAPFGGQTLYDILFLISAGITAYLGIDCLRDSR